MKNKRISSTALEKAMGPIWHLQQQKEAIERAAGSLQHLQQNKEIIQRALEGPLQHLQQQKEAIERAAGSLQHLQQNQEIIQRVLEGPLQHIQQYQEVLERALGPLWRQQAAIAKIMGPVRLLQETIDNISLVPQRVISRKLYVRLDMIVYAWPVSDESLIDFIAQAKEVYGSEIGAPICKYYSENNWEKFGALVERWKNCDLVASRFQILKSCFEILKNSSNSLSDTANAVIPALVCQFDGIVEDMNVPKDQNIMDAYVSDVDNETAFLGAVSEFYMNSFEFDAKKKSGENLIDINRHKLAHGDPILLDYGTEENLVRMFLYIDEAIRYWETEQDKGKSDA